MTLVRTTTIAGIAAILIGLAAPGFASTETGYLYISDYGQQALDRFSYSFDTNTHVISNWQPAGKTTGSAKFITSNVQEGLQGTANDIIVVNTGGNGLTRYDLNGNSIGSITVKNLDGSTHTFNGVGNVAITTDGQYMYAPEEAGNKIVKIRLFDGQIVNQVTLNGAHDVLIKPDGTILATAYSANSGVYHFNSDLTGQTTLIASGDNGLHRPSGLSLSSSGILYIQDNIFPTGSLSTGANSVSQYNITGTPTFISKTTSNSLQFDFGSDLGPDGNLYIAALGGGQGGSNFGVPNGYTNGVYEFDTTTSAVSLAVGGYVTGTGAPSTGFESPKYLQFGFNFITANDAGISVPEPGSVAMLGGLFAMGTITLLSKRRRQNRTR